MCVHGRVCTPVCVVYAVKEAKVLRSFHCVVDSTPPVDVKLGGTGVKCARAYTCTSTTAQMIRREEVVLCQRRLTHIDASAP